MKLIDILVQELPKRGGWPFNITAAVQDSSGYVYQAGGGNHMFHSELADDWMMAEIPREQYEAALAASKPEWDGEGLPPVGVDIEYKFTKVKYRTDFSRGKVLAYGMHNVFMEHWSSKNEFIQPLDKIEFRPIRSEADKKKQEIIFAIAELCRGSASNGHSAELIYDAIKSGKIVID
ncbi:hypothetical protein ACHHY8_02205 [Enterobacter cloacae complex sp. 2024EL-00215]|uniref:hypothetical protein n=1 Tax=unclassified Enterobacter cloacae complex TaxID=2757714 RepID=UPI003752CA9E